jgi:tryptophan synthase alpha subunit
MNRWLDESDVAGTFILLVSNLVTINELGMAFDDPAVDSLTLQSIAGIRAFPAFDVVQTSIITEPFLDGVDTEHDAVYSGLYQLMQVIKAAGIKASFELEGN